MLCYSDSSVSTNHRAFNTRLRIHHLQQYMLVTSLTTIQSTNSDRATELQCLNALPALRYIHYTNVQRLKELIYIHNLNLSRPIGYASTLSPAPGVLDCSSSKTWNFGKGRHYALLHPANNQLLCRNSGRVLGLRKL